MRMLFFFVAVIALVLGGSTPTVQGQTHPPKAIHTLVNPAVPAPTPPTVQQQNSGSNPTWTAVLGYSVIAAVVTALATLLGLLINGLWLTPRLEQFKATQARADIHREYSCQTVLAAHDCCGRLHEIRRHWPPSYLDAALFLENAPIQVIYNNDDLHHRKAKLTSTIYRLCAVLGWLELYRQELAYPDNKPSQNNTDLDRIRKLIDSALADNQLRPESHTTWKDPLIFREEQRAVAQMMIIGADDKRSVMGYYDFHRMLNDSSAKEQQHWINIIANVLTDPRSDGQDFRPFRLDLMIVHIVDLIQVLEGQNVPRHFQDWRTASVQRLDHIGITQEKLLQYVDFSHRKLEDESVRSVPVA